MKMKEIDEILKDQQIIVEKLKEIYDGCDHLSQLLVIPLWKQEEGVDSSTFLGQFEDLHLFIWANSKIAPWELSVMFGRLAWISLQLFQSVCGRVMALKKQLSGEK